MLGLRVFVFNACQNGFTFLHLPAEKLSQQNAGLIDS